MTTTSPPTRSERAKCWEARDNYFKCLDEQGVVAPSSEGKSSVCFPLRKQFEKDCVKSWVCVGSLSGTLGHLFFVLSSVIYVEYAQLNNE
jgi:hypothetical protein